MIPGNKFLLTEIEFEKQPSRTYKMSIDNLIINGFCDGLEAVKQAIYKILNTERYEYSIYSWNYGIELKDLYGEPLDYAYAELERRITEALMWDKRILSVVDFEFELLIKNAINVTFMVNTIYVNVKAEKEVIV